MIVQAVMRFNLKRLTMLLLAVLLAVGGPVVADERPGTDGKTPDAVDVRALLEQGRDAGSLPKGMVIRVAACLAACDKEGAGDEASKELRENWEFTAEQVRRIEFEDVEDDAGNGTRERVDSRPFDSKALCKELLDGQAIEIQTRRGEGPEVAFVGTRYCAGTRSIEVEWKGAPILALYETNGPTLRFYRESDARAFGALYERLAGQARVLFQSNATEAK